MNAFNCASKKYKEVNILEKLLELLNGITEDTSIEEARRIILDAIEAANSALDDVKALKDLVDEQNESLADKDYEIARLKEENGRIYRDRAESIVKHAEDEVNKVSEKTNDELEAELIENIDI
jgi:hypothetical protein